MRTFLKSSVGKTILLAGCLLGGYEANEHWHLIGSTPATAEGSSWFAPSQQTTTLDIEVKNTYQTQSGRVLLGTAEDYLDPNNQTVVVPASLARSKGIDNATVGKRVHVTGRKTTYKGRPQIIAASIEVK